MKFFLNRVIYVAKLALLLHPLRGVLISMYRLTLVRHYSEGMLHRKWRLVFPLRPLVVRPLDPMKQVLGLLIYHWHLGAQVVEDTARRASADINLSSFNSRYVANGTLAPGLQILISYQLPQRDTEPRRSPRTRYQQSGMSKTNNIQVRERSFSTHKYIT